MAIPRPAYAGPGCPHCRHPFASDALHDGTIVCPTCLTQFEARVFHPPQRSGRVLQLAQSGPEGATACANHPRNVAVGACDRCGLLICSLCQLDVESGKYCPSCFERLTQEGSIETARNRFRDYGSLSLVWAFVGLIFTIVFVGIPLAMLSLYYALRALRRREHRASLAVVVVAVMLAFADLVFSGFYLWALFVSK